MNYKIFIRQEDFQKFIKDDDWASADRSHPNQQSLKNPSNWAMIFENEITNYEKTSNNTEEIIKINRMKIRLNKDYDNAKRESKYINIYAKCKFCDISYNIVRNKIEQKLEPVEFIVKTDKNHNYDMHFKIIIMISFSKINHHLNLH